MSWGGPNFVLAIIAMSTLGWVINTWVRTKHGYPVENEWGGMAERGDPVAARKVELLTAENGKLVGQVTRLEDRIAVLERIATETNGRAAQLADKIDSLR